MTDQSSLSFTGKLWQKRSLLLQDVLLISTMAVLAACGLIYEYLLSHYAGRVIGMMEMAIYAMIGIMIVSMGMGSFAAKLIKHPFTAFAWLELFIGILGAASILIIAWIMAISHTLPKVIIEIFGLPEGVMPSGDLFLFMQKIAKQFPYWVGALLGFLIGMEIPLIARVREAVYQKHLEHNAGTIYGADYVGAGVGAALWIVILIGMENTQAAGLTAAANLVAGLIFLTRYRHRIGAAWILYGLHFLFFALVIVVIQYGDQWTTRMSNLMYQDEVVYSKNTRFQHITLTERSVQNREPVLNLYLNGRLQFSSNDEQVYHSMLVYPAMAAAARQEKVLIIGGGDGLGLRNVLRWNPETVDLVDLDEDLVKLFKDGSGSSEVLDNKLRALNENALNDPKVNLIYADAFIAVDDLLEHNRSYDVIIVDLPDPNHPDLNKLYSDYFYNKLKHLLMGDGVLAVQSTSPFHAKKAFLAIGKTLESVGFSDVEQYHQNVPSFGEWGWSIATKAGASALERLTAYETFPVSDPWVTPALIRGSFAFPKDFFYEKQDVNVNRLGSNQLYQYHFNAWRRDQGLFFEANKISN